MEPPPPSEFERAAGEYGLRFDPGDLERLSAYLAMLLDATTRFNLTAITDPDEAWLKHVFDSLTLLPFTGDATTVLDLGSGGGLPGVPLAIAMPGVRFVLLEATGKKAAFLRQVAERLELSNVEVVNERAEIAGRDAVHRERYDVVVARAVGRLAVLIELAAPMARIEGHVLAVKGARAAEEIAEAKQALYMLHCRVMETVRTPTGTIVVIRKARRTPKHYPRRPGEPKRCPLGA